MSLVRERYADFGPTLAQEKLEELHELCVSVETLRKWMIQDGLWVPRALRQRPPHQPRRRRECLGELVQIDGCEHAWFDERGPFCTLLVFVDDATSGLQTIPGIGPVASHVLYATIGEIERFSNARKLAAYAGLVPTVRRPSQCP